MFFKGAEDNGGNSIGGGPELSEDCPTCPSELYPVVHMCSELELIRYRTGQDRTGQDRTGQDRTGQDRTGQDTCSVGDSPRAFMAGNRSWDTRIQLLSCSTECLSCYASTKFSGGSELGDVA